MKYTFSKTKPTEARYQKLTPSTGMFSALKSVFCCFDFRRVYTSVMDLSTETPYNNRDIFYANNAPIQPLFVFA